MCSSRGRERLDARSLSRHPHPSRRPGAFPPPHLPLLLLLPLRSHFSGFWVQLCVGGWGLGSWGDILPMGPSSPGRQGWIATPVPRGPTSGVGSDLTLSKSSPAEPQPPPPPLQNGRAHPRYQTPRTSARMFCMLSLFKWRGDTSLERSLARDTGAGHRFRPKRKYPLTRS